jgi:hypothetical protein
MTKTVVALYDDREAAQRAVSELVNNGFERDDISLLAPDASGEFSRELDIADPTNTSAAQGAGLGAGLGAALGGLGGLLVGLGALTIPGIGPVLAAGPLAAAMSGLAGAGVGAIAGGVTGGLLGALIDMGIPEERAHYYAEGVRRGGTLIVVRTNDERTRDAVDIVNRQRPVDVNNRADEWRKTGWSRFDPEGSVYSNGPVVPGMARNATSERGTPLNDGRQSASDDPLVGGHARGATSQMGTPLNDGRQAPYTDDPVVGGGARSATIEPTAGAHSGHGHPSGYNDDDQVVAGMARSADADFDRYDSEFETHFRGSRYSTDYSYQDFRPAYRYGYDLARNPRYRGRAWTDFESDAQRDWDTQHPGSWERFKDAIRHGWERFKDALD